ADDSRAARGAVRGVLSGTLHGARGTPSIRGSGTHMEGRMKLGMVVLAGGIGKRIGRPFPKQFLLLGGKPLLIHVLDKARVIAEIEKVVTTCPEPHLEETRRLVSNHGFDARFSCILGGDSRQESVRLGLEAL